MPTKTSHSETEDQTPEPAAKDDEQSASTQNSNQQQVNSNDDKLNDIMNDEDSNQESHPAMHNNDEYGNQQQYETATNLEIPVSTYTDHNPHQEATTFKAKIVLRPDNISENETSNIITYKSESTTTGTQIRR